MGLSLNGRKRNHLKFAREVAIPAVGLETLASAQRMTEWRPEGAALLICGPGLTCTLCPPLMCSRCGWMLLLRSSSLLAQALGFSWLLLATTSSTTTATSECVGLWSKLGNGVTDR